MKDNKKLAYIQTHISVIEERMETLKENFKWIASDVKFIKKISKPKNENFK